MTFKLRIRGGLTRVIIFPCLVKVEPGSLASVNFLKFVRWQPSLICSVVGASVQEVPS